MTQTFGDKVVGKELKEFLDNLSTEDKRNVQRYLQEKDMLVDVKYRFEDTLDDICEYFYDDMDYEITKEEQDEIVNNVVKRYVWDGDYSDERGFWENVDDLIMDECDRIFAK